MSCRENPNPYLSLIRNCRKLRPRLRTSADKLIFALATEDYAQANTFLEKLKKTLSPRDAFDACVCAMNGPEGLLNAVLEHCPPVSEFLPKPFRMRDILSRDNVDMLDIFLKLGADPNGKDSDFGDTPLNYAFCHKSVSCMERLLEDPALHPELTEEMLQEWGRLGLHDGETGPTFLRCCHLLLNALGVPAEPDDPFPIPPQLRLDHALHHRNIKLAAHICRTRPLTEQEQADAQAFCRKWDALSIFRLWDDPFPRDYADFLDGFLQRCPHALHMPEIRAEVVCTALRLPEDDSPLMRWVERMDDGPVLLSNIPLRISDLPENSVQPRADKVFITRWTKHLSPRLIPTVNANSVLPFFLQDDDYRILLPWLHVTGKRPDCEVSAVARLVLERAPSDLLPMLLQPGGLLAQEAPSALLQTCENLPQARRSCILELLGKTADDTL